MNILLTTRQDPAEARNPVAILDLAAFLRQQGHVVDCYFVDRVPDRPYDLVGLSVLRAIDDQPIQDALALRQRFSGKVVVGGKWAETASPAERATLEAHDIELHAGPGEPYFRPGPFHLQDYPAWDKRDFETLGEVHYEIMSTRGCAYHCNFCHNTETKLSFFSPRRTADNIELLLSLGIQEIFFVDDIFTLKPDHMAGLLGELEHRGVSLANRCMFFTHVNYTNEKSLRWIDAFHPTSVQIGIESGDDGMLRALGKTFTAEKALAAIHQLSQHGHRVIALFLIGYPGETEASLQATRDFIRRARPMLHYVWVSYYQPVPGTVGYELAVRRDPGFAGRRSNREITYLDPNLTVGTLIKYREQMMKATPSHPIVALFEHNDFRSFAVLRDLIKEFGQPSLYILWHHFDAASPFPFSTLDPYNRLVQSEIVAFVAQSYGVPPERLERMVQDYPLFLKVLLVLYARRFLGLDYCLMTDNDLIALQPLSELVELSARRQPFFIQEIGAADSIPALREFITSRLGRTIRYRQPRKGGGYNIGLCGLDLTVFDVLDGEGLLALIDLFGRIPEWWRDQAFLVPMNFTSSQPVHVFADQRYKFFSFDDFACREQSKLYHALCTRDKSGVTLLYSLRYGKLNARRYLNIIDYVRAHECQRLLEIGVWKGDTSELLLLNSRHPTLEYHGVDVFEESNAALVAKEVSLPADSLAQVQGRLTKVSRGVHLHKGYSHQVAGELAAQGLRFDVIWIDGGHSYDTVRQDFHDYLPLLSDRGVIFFDDYTADPYLPDVKRFIDAELRRDPALVVTVHDTYVDHYRGHDYQVVSVRRKPVASVTLEPLRSVFPPAGFFLHLLEGDHPQDAPWEAPYLLAEARRCFEQGTCLEYGVHLLNLARAHLPAGPLVATARLLLERNVCLPEAVVLLDQGEKLGGPTAETAGLRASYLRCLGRLQEAEAVLQAAVQLHPRNAELHALHAACLMQLCRFTEAEVLLEQTRQWCPQDTHLNQLRQQIEALLLDPAQAEAYGQEEFWRLVHVGIFLRGHDRLEESRQHLLRALALDPTHESALSHYRETLKLLIRRAQTDGRWEEALRLQNARPCDGEKDAEWRTLTARTRSMIPQGLAEVPAPEPPPTPASPAGQGAGPGQAPRKFCSSFWTESVLQMTGEFLVCCRNPTVLGNYEKDGLLACWHSETAQEMRRKASRGEFPDEHCAQCHRLGATFSLGRPLAAPLDRIVQELEGKTRRVLTELRALAGLFNKTDLDAQAETVLREFAVGLERVEAFFPRPTPADVSYQLERLRLLSQVVRSFLSGDEKPPVIAPTREVNLIAVCNARCVHCVGRHYDQVSKGLRGPDGTLHKLISPKAHEAALEYPDHIFEFWCNGTEFLIYPKWKEIYRSLAPRGIVLSLSTNGIALDEDAVHTLLEDRALTHLNISLDGATKQTIEAIRVNVRFERLVQNLRYLIHCSNERGRQYNLNFTFTIMRDNYREIPQFVEFVQSLFEGERPLPGTLLYTFLLPEGNASYYDFLAQQHHSLLDPEELKQLLLEAKQRADRYGLRANVTYNHSLDQFIQLGFPFPPMPPEASRRLAERNMLALHPPQTYGANIPWEKPIQLCLSDFLRPGQCALDVGANVGGLSIAMSRLVGPTGQVHAFEANRRLVPVLQRDLGLNGASNVTVVNRAAWSKSGEQLPFYCDDRMWAQSSSLVYKVSDSTETIETVCMDDYVAQHSLSPRVIKVDVEGAEYEVLRGTEKTLRAQAPVLVLEYWPRGNDDPLDFLESLGYVCFDTNLYCRVNRKYYQQAPRTSIVANVVAVPPWAQSVYASVAIQPLAEVPLAPGGLHSQEYALPQAGRYVVHVELEGPDEAAVTLLVGAGAEQLYLLGGSVKECREWGQTGLVIQVAEATRIHARLVPQNPSPNGPRLTRTRLSAITGLGQAADRDARPLASGISARPASPKLSIVTPTFNCASLIEHCIESVLAQGYPNLEHIVVDGASKDNTVEILKRYPHVRWISEPDHGEAEALNKGLRLVTGEVIGWLNGDDQYAPGALEKVVKMFAGEPSRHLVYGKTIFIDDHGLPTNWVVPYAPLNLSTLARWFRLDLFQPSIFFSRDLLQDVGLFREDLEYGVDYEYWLRIADKGYVFHYLDHVLALSMIYRSGGKTETPYAVKAREWLQILSKFLPRLNPGERIHFWKDYYLFRVRMANEYYKGESIPLPDSPEACAGLLLAQKDAGFLQPIQVLGLLDQSPFAVTPNGLGAAAEVFRVTNQPQEASKALEWALALDRRSESVAATPSR